MVKVFGKLIHPEYVTLVKNKIENVIEDLTGGHGSEENMLTFRQMFWEILKLSIIGVTIPNCSKRKKSCKNGKKIRDGNSKARKDVN